MFRLELELTPTFKLLFEDKAQLQFQSQVEVGVGLNQNIERKVGMPLAVATN